MNFKSLSSITNCLKGISSTAGGFYWTYSDENKNDKKIIKIKKSKSELLGIKIDQYDENMNFIKTYPSMRSIFREFIKGHRATSDGLKKSILKNSKMERFLLEIYKMKRYSRIPYENLGMNRRFTLW